MFRVSLSSHISAFHLFELVQLVLKLRDVVLVSGNVVLPLVHVFVAGYVVYRVGLTVLVEL